MQRLTTSMTQQRNYNTITEIVSWLKESAIFAWRYIWNPSRLGTPFVMSPFVAKQLLIHVGNQTSNVSCKYLEVGAGTGAMTDYLIKKLRPQDELHLVEIDEELSKVLRQKYEKIKNVFVHHASIQEWQHTSKDFDVIISTIPLNSLSKKEQVTEIFKAYTNFLKSEGIISFGEYVGTSTIRNWILFGEAKGAFQELQKVKATFFKENSIETKIVYANLPPARIIHCKINTTSH